MTNPILEKFLRSLGATDDAAPSLPLPPQMQNHEGDERRVGVEFEFSGLSMEHIARVVRDTLDGQIDPLSAYEYKIRETPVGDFKLELDYAYLKNLGRREDRGKDIRADLERLSEDMLAALAKQVVPFEIVCPPIAMSHLGVLELLVTALREAGARGTAESPVYAFGMHLNQELPALDATTIRDYLRAFMVLFDWLRKESNVDFSRRVFPYIQAYPKDYHRLVCSDGYAPDLQGLIDDYLEHNPTRNRALDMLPLFSFLDAPRVNAVVADALVNARPTLHYRLPNCEIERPDWNIGLAWRHWLRVEHLVAQPERLEQACAAHVDHLSKPLSNLMSHWIDKVQPWVCAEGDL